MAATASSARRASLANLARMGHCAPSVMQTLLDVSHTRLPWLVRLAGGLPGGIGNTGHECGAITAPLLMLGLRHASDPLRYGVPVVIYKGHELLRRFAIDCGTTSCAQIRGGDRLPLKCVHIIMRAPAMCADVLEGECRGTLAAEAIACYRRLHEHFAAKGFHCAHSVLHCLHDKIDVSQALLDGTSGFVGGTVCAGMTCSAFAAGVMALGLARGEVESSRLRVLRMIGTMALGGDAFADGLNAFNGSMNRGHRLGEWFAARYGSTQCRAITRCDFASSAGVGHYIAANNIARCEDIATEVAREVRAMLPA